MQIKTILDNLDRYSSHILRYSIALIYLWFGALKLVNLSPAEELVTETLFFLPPQTAILFVGLWEVVTGLLLLHQKTLKYGLILLLLHIPGIFSPLILAPGMLFNRFPHELTLEGHYVLKNLVLLGAALKLVAEELDRNPEMMDYWKNLIE